MGVLVVAVMTVVVPLVVEEVREEFLAAEEAGAVVLMPGEPEAQVDAERSGCGFTDERNNKKKSSRR
jgi:hypothetical protein